MPDSQIVIPCPVCGEETPTEICTRINGNEQPEILAAFTRCDINRAVCPLCRHHGVVPEPVFVELGDTLAAYMPVQIPSNRKANIAKRLGEQLQSYAFSGSTRVCFGPLQLRKALPGLPWEGRTPEYCFRFDDAGTPLQRVQSLKHALIQREDDTALLARLGEAFP